MLLAQTGCAFLTTAFASAVPLQDVVRPVWHQSDRTRQTEHHANLEPRGRAGVADKTADLLAGLLCGSGE